MHPSNPKPHNKLEIVARMYLIIILLYFTR